MELNLNTVIRRARVAKASRTVVRATATVQDGDVIIAREIAGIWRSGPGLTTPTTQTLPEYRVSVRGQTDTAGRIFEMYDPALADADALAANRKVCLFYLDGDALTLLKDYRSETVS